MLAVKHGAGSLWQRGRRHRDHRTVEGDRTITRADAAGVVSSLHAEGVEAGSGRRDAGDDAVAGNAETRRQAAAVERPSVGRISAAGTHGVAVSLILTRVRQRGWRDGDDRAGHAQRVLTRPEAADAVRAAHGEGVIPREGGRRSAQETGITQAHAGGQRAAFNAEGVRSAATGTIHQDSAVGHKLLGVGESWRRERNGRAVHAQAERQGAHAIVHVTCANGEGVDAGAGTRCAVQNTRVRKHHAHRQSTRGDVPGVGARAARRAQGRRRVSRILDGI